jgi:predicted DNA-binding transcriptional regulator AlpA
MDEKDAYNVQEFCQRHGISRAALYNAIKAKHGPRLMRVGNRVMISREAAEAWRREREEATEHEDPAKRESRAANARSRQASRTRKTVAA